MSFKGSHIFVRYMSRRIPRAVTYRFAETSRARTAAEARTSSVVNGSACAPPVRSEPIHVVGLASSHGGPSETEDRVYVYGWLVPLASLGASH